MNPPLCSIRHLTVQYRNGETPALVDVSLDIANGERLAIIGESGSGKTTLARALAGLLPETARSSGTVSWTGYEPRPQAGRDLAYIFQEPGGALNPVLRIGEQVAESARRHLHLSRDEACRRAIKLLADMRLPEPEKTVDAFAHQLSGGQQQRVAIAAALSADPRILVADEATSALDVVVQSQIVQLLDDLVRLRNMTLIFITHDIALAARLADRIAVLKGGRLQDLGKAVDVILHPQSAYTQALLAAHLDLDTPPLVSKAAL